MCERFAQRLEENLGQDAHGRHMQRVERDVTSARALRRALANVYKDVRQVREDMPQHSEVQFDNTFVSVSFKLSLLFFLK